MSVRVRAPCSFRGHDEPDRVVLGKRALGEADQGGAGNSTQEMLKVEAGRGEGSCEGRVFEGWMVRRQGIEQDTPAPWRHPWKGVCLATTCRSWTSERSGV